MRGNLVELAVAFVVGASFATVVTAFTAMFMDLLGKLGGKRFGVVAHCFCTLE